MKKEKITKELFKINMLMTFLVILGNAVIFFLVNTNSSNFTILNCYLAISILFAYSYLLLVNIKKNLPQLKKEVLYINYPLNIAFFFLFLLLFLVCSILFLFNLNADAANTTFVSIFFFTMLSMILPSIIFLVIIHFIVPAFIIPNLKSDKYSVSNYKNIYFIFLAIYFGICLLQGFSTVNFLNNFENQDKFKSSMLKIRYSTEYLKTNQNISANTQQKIANDNFQVPFFYTSDSFQFADYKDAEIFCKSLNARVPNNLEIYHIIFNYFNIFGDKYYWTSDKDGNTPIVLHFKNMSFSIEKLPSNIKPYIYCVSSSDENYGFTKKQYFYRDNSIEKKETEKKLHKDNFQELDNLLNDIDTKNYNPQEWEYNNKYSDEKKHVNFSVKEVSPEYMQRLINQGYFYDTSILIKKDYEASDYVLNSKIRKNTKDVQLCYYPFTDYGEMNIHQERSIWAQSFCSPSFVVINSTPAYISNSDKDAFCNEQEGRLPNIPELAAILKTFDINTTGTKFWTNNKIYDNYSNKQYAVAAYYKDERFMSVENVYDNINAYAYCIKEKNNPSSIIANYKSKFKGYNGDDYARKICPNCYYYEVPDTIVRE